MNRYRFIIVVAALVTLTFWLAGCNALEGLVAGVHKDLQNYNQGNADARKAK